MDGKEGVSDNNEWGTPKEVLEFIKEHVTRRKIDYDLAASKKYHVARKYFTKKQNVFSKEYLIRQGSLCFLNPPYHDKKFPISEWLRLCFSLQSYNIDVILLVNATITSNRAFSIYVGRTPAQRENNRVKLFFPPRIRFLKKGGVAKINRNSSLIVLFEALHT